MHSAESIVCSESVSNRTIQQIPYTSSCMHTLDHSSTDWCQITASSCHSGGSMLYAGMRRNKFSVAVKATTKCKKENGRFDRLHTSNSIYYAMAAPQYRRVHVRVQYGRIQKLRARHECTCSYSGKRIERSSIVHAYTSTYRRKQRILRQSACACLNKQMMIPEQLYIPC